MPCCGDEPGRDLARTVVQTGGARTDQVEVMTLLDGLLGGRYRLHSQIAVGGMGEVWRADDTLLGRTVAVKTLRPEYADDEEFRARFRAEARHAAGLVHPGIAAVLDFGESEDRAWLVMELVEGEPLSTVLRREGPIGAERTLDVVAQTAAALQVAHDAGVVHRDVKPGNLLVQLDGAVKVTDFGIASAADAVPLTLTGSVVGTAYYLSPEQASGNGAVAASDLYSLGVVAYECLTGSRPFPGVSPVTVAMAHVHSAPPPLPASVPAPVRDLVGRLLSKDPRSRAASAGSLSDEATALLAALRAGGTSMQDVDELAARGAGVPPRPGQPHRRAVRSAAVLLAVLALGLGLRSTLETGRTVVPTIAAGTPQASALATLQGAGLAVRSSPETSSDLPPGTVLALRPSPGSEVAAGSVVTLVVSTGTPAVTVRAEELVGRPVGEVRDELAARGLAPRLVSDGRGAGVGTVSAVEPVGKLSRGTAVVLHVVPAPAPPIRPRTDQDPAPGQAPGGKTQGKRS